MKKKSLSNSKLRRKSSVTKKTCASDELGNSNIDSKCLDPHVMSSPLEQTKAASLVPLRKDSLGQTVIKSPIGETPEVFCDDTNSTQSVCSMKVQSVSTTCNTVNKIRDIQTNKEVSFLNSEVAHSPLIDTPGEATGPNALWDEDLPSTQILDNRVLKNVIAYVEVRTTNDNRSEAIRKELENLGAMVTKKFTDDVTHVIFKEGSKRTKTKAMKNKCHLVSVLWVDSCRQYQEHVSETLYPAILPTTNNGTPLLISKLKKAKSMQPTTFEDEVANSAERYNKKKKKLVDKLQSTDKTPQNSPNLGRILVQETQPRTPIDINTPIRLMIPDTPPSMREKLEQLKAKDSDTPVLDKDDDPLQRRLFGANASFDSNDVDHLVDGLKDEINMCINSVGLPESPIPNTSENSHSVQQSVPQSTVVDKSNEKITLINAKKKSPNVNKRRKSIAVVKFADECDESLKPKRTSNRRKSIAVFTPTEEGQGKLDGLSGPEDKNTLKTIVRRGKGRRKSIVSLTAPDPLEEDATDSDLPALECHLNKKETDGMQHLTAITNQGEELNTINNAGAISTSNKTQRRKSVKGKRKSMASEQILSVNVNQTCVSAIERDSSLSEKIKLVAGNDNFPINNSSCDESSKLVTDNSVFQDIPNEQEDRVLNQEDCASSALKATSTQSSKKPSRQNSKKRLLPLTDMEPDLPLMSKTPEYQSPITARRKKPKFPSASECNSSISALFPHKTAVKKQVRASSVSERSSSSKNLGLAGESHKKTPSTSSLLAKWRTASCSSAQQKTTSSSSLKASNKNVTESVGSSTETTNITMTDDLTPISNYDNTTGDLTLQETTVHSTCSTTQSENSMSAVFGETFINSMSGRVPPRPSIDEFNLRTNKHIRKHKLPSSTSTKPSDSDSSDGGVSKKYKRSPPSRPSMVMTSLHAEEQDVIISVVKKLGNFVISDNVIESTTHLICGGPRRTLNVLYGIMKGIWIVNKQWVLSSLEACMWLPEENFEVTDFFPVVKVTREGRLLHKENYRQLSLKEVGTIYVAQKTSPPRHHLLNLLKLCGAKVINYPSKADIYMGHEFVPDKTCVNPVWVLDCITHQNVIDLERYLLGRPKRESSPEF